MRSWERKFLRDVMVSAIASVDEWAEDEDELAGCVIVLLTKGKDGELAAETRTQMVQEDDREEE